MTAFTTDTTLTITFVDDTTMEIKDFRVENDIIIVTTLEGESKMFQTTQVVKIQRLTTHTNIELEEQEE